MKILLWLALQIGVWSSTQVQQRLRRGLTVESLEVEMQLETMTTEEQKQQIHKALGHHHNDGDESNVEVLEKVLETGEYPTPRHDEPKTTEELIEHYLDAEPAGGGKSLTSKGGRFRNVNQPETLGVHGGGGNDAADDKKSKFSEEEDDDDDEDVPPRKDNDKMNADSALNDPSVPPSLSPTVEDDAGFTAQDNIVGDVTLVTVTMEHAAFLYERTSLEVPSQLDLSRLAFVTNSMLLEMFQHIFTNIISADYISMDISEYTVLREDFVDFQVNVYFNGHSESIPDAQQLREIVMEELTPGSEHYDLYLEWLQQSESPVLSSTRGFVFVASKDEIDLILNNKVPTANPAPIDPKPDNSTGDSSAESGQEKTNHLVPLIILGLIFVGAAAWFSYRRKVHARRPQRGHNLMKLKGERDDSTVATYKTAVYTETALKKVPVDKEKGPTMEELDEVSIGESSGSSASFSPPPSPLSGHGLTARSMRSIVRGLRKPSWTLRSVSGSSSGDASDSIVFSTPVSTRKDDIPQAPPLKPVTYDFDDTPRSRLPRKKYSKADVRLMEDDYANELDIKLHKRPVVTAASSAATEPSLTLPELKMKDLMVDTSMERPIEEDCTETASPPVTESNEANVKETTETTEHSNSSESLLEEEKEAILFACKTLGCGQPPKECAKDECAKEEDTDKSTKDKSTKESSYAMEEATGTKTPPLVQTLQMKHGSELIDPSDLPEWMRKFKEMGLDKHID